MDKQIKKEVNYLLKYTNWYIFEKIICLMSKAERTKQFIIEKAAPIFNTKGFAGTSLSDLTEATGLTKGSIYGNFESKEQIALDAFKYGVVRIKQAVQSKTDTVENTDKIFLFLDFFLDYVFSPPVDGGCMLLNTAVEADDTQPVLKKEVAKELLTIVTYVQKLLEEASIHKKLTEGYTTEMLAYAIFCAIEGAMMIARTQNNIRPMQQVVYYWKNQLKALQTL